MVRLLKKKTYRDSNDLKIWIIYLYDSLGRKTDEVFLNSDSIEVNRHYWIFDTLGNLIEEYIYTGQRFKYMFDSLGRLVEKREKRYNLDYDFIYSYDYDSSGKVFTMTRRIENDIKGIHTEKHVYRYNEKGQLVLDDCWNIKTSRDLYCLIMKYDNLGRLIYTGRMEKGHTFCDKFISYKYDKAGNIIEKTILEWKKYHVTMFINITTKAFLLNKLGLGIL
jgi:hypothetical protein